MNRGPRPIFSFDWGMVYDHCVLTILWRVAGIRALNPGYDGRPVFLAQVHIWPQATPLHAVVAATTELAARLRPAYIATETVGLGAMPSTELRRQVEPRLRERTLWCFIHTTREIKLAAYSFTRLLLEQNRLVLRRDPVPLRQLAGVVIEQTTRGSRIEGSDDAVHDDVSDSIAFTCLPHVPARSRNIVCGLASLSDPKTAPPEAEVPTLDLPVVATGSGLRLYERPPLQGVADSNVWIPEADDLAKRTGGRTR